MPTLFESLPSEFVSKTVLYEYKTPVVEALNDVKKLGAVVVVQNGEYCGIVDDRSIFRTRGFTLPNFSKNFSIGKLAKKLPLLDSGTSLNRLINYFHDFSAKALPYQDGNKIIGMVKRSVVLSTILSTHLISKMRVGEIMSTPVIAIDSDANIAQAGSVMEKNKIARLLVVDGGKLAGLLSQRDIFESLSNPQERLPERKSTQFSLSNISVKSMMKADVYTIDYGMPADTAIRDLLEKKVSSLVVTRGNKPVGIVTVRDIIEAAAAVTVKMQSKVIISGLDEDTKEYLESIQASMNNLVEKIDKFGRFGVDYVSVNIKRSRERNYEIKARLALQKRGTIFAYASGYSLESTLSSLINTFYKRIKEKKESVLSNKREAERYYGLYKNKSNAEYGIE